MHWMVVDRRWHLVSYPKLGGQRLAAAGRLLVSSMNSQSLGQLGHCFWPHGSGTSVDVYIYITYTVTCICVDIRR